ncbi:RHS repeat domain-containing protein [Winogradskyella sp. MIT101101]|uniref:RHS repeat domain-containing protein n=1 Tax=Winogradskyella sp. MIT101101 TaxID=3098297 RepID=UPI00399A5EB0
MYGNVSMSVTGKPFTNQTWYSYDVYGRVKWLVQKTAGLDCVKTINYSYDPLTGQVTKVDYQRHVPSERFVHKYDYDVAGQLTMVSTSRDDVDYAENARYFYTETGTLRRTEIAENLQGIDYVYNINGQLKAINSPLGEGFKDPGNDGPGTNGFMTDVFGMILDYHDQDYTRGGTYLNGLKNTSANNQFNGNIASARWNNDTPAAGTVDTYAYSYNKNNWLARADFGTTTTSNGNSTFSADANGDYRVDNITYDANGNIKTLTRNGVTNASGSNDMDEFTYHYKDGKNQLTAVEDTGDNVDPARYNDLRDQYITTTVSGPFGDETVQSQDNYVYNGIGQLETNVQDGISYEYSASGLVTRINGFTDSNTGDWSTIYSQDFTTATFSEQGFWDVEEGSAFVNYNSYYTNTVNVHCGELQDTYGNSMGIVKPGNILNPQYPGELSASRELTAMNGKLHRLSADLIVKQIEHKQRLRPFDPNDPQPPPQLADNPMGYKLEVLDANGQVLAATTYNYPNPVLIDDPDLNDIQPCSAFYTNGHSLQFTPGTGTIDLKVTAYYDASVPEAAIYVDNIKLEVAEAPKVAFYYNDRGHRVRKESYDDNGNTFRTVYVRDASGNPLAIYDEATGPTVQQPQALKEHPVYGAGRLGVYYRDNGEGTYAYQVSDHLGNVRAVMVKDGNNALSLTNKTDYYPFGMAMPDRNVEGNYRYGYQGEYAEKDPETGKEAFELRLWDNRIGRWLNPDPAHEFNSPYLGLGNDPISFVDKKGDSVWVFSETITKWPVLGLAGHLFLRVKTDKIDVTIELTGQKTKFDFDGDGKKEEYTGRTGIPLMRRFWPKHYKDGRGPVSEPLLVSADSPGYEVERRIFQVFSKFINREQNEDGIYDFNNLPDYDPWGPNSNGFVQFLLLQADNIKLKANDGVPGHPGIYETGPYEEYLNPDHHKINNN